MNKSNIAKLYNITLFLIVIVFFICKTLIPMLNHVPSTDEAQNYTAAYFMNFSNFLQDMGEHGHTIIWYLIIMPFAKLNLYPYPMLIVNYIILLSGFAIMWFKAPLNNYLKIIFIFSYMMINYFPINARCYTIGLLGFFIIASLFKNQLKKPVLYSVMLGLTANTSAIAAIGAFGLLIPFLYNLIKNRHLVSKKQIAISFLVSFGLFYFMMLPHLFNLTNIRDDKLAFTQFALDEYYFYTLKDFFFIDTTFVVSYFLIIILLLLNKSNKENRNEYNQSKFFLVSTLIFFFVFTYYYYQFRFYHRYFLLIFIFMVMWMQNKYNGYKLKDIVVYALLTLLFFFHLGCKIGGNQPIYDWGKLVRADSEKYENSTIIFAGDPDYLAHQLSPFFFTKKGIKLYNNNVEYDYKLIYNKLTDEDVKNIAEKSKNPVYIVKENISNPTDININTDKYMLYENYKDVIIVYKVK